jgi:hypothetical protein
MGVLSWFRKVTNVVVHDFTYSFPGHGVSLVKPVGDGTRAFLVGQGNVPKELDIVIVRAKGTPVINIRYEIESINEGADGRSWKAYGRLVQRPRRAVGSPNEKPPLRP